MPKKSAKSALGAALSEETKAFKARLVKANAQNLGASPSAPHEDSPSSPARVVREAFTIPEAEHAQIEAIRARLLSRVIAVSKSEVVRAGLLMLVETNETTRRTTFARLERVKTGRPSKKSV